MSVSIFAYAREMPIEEWAFDKYPFLRVLVPEEYRGTATTSQDYIIFSEALGGNGRVNVAFKTASNLGVEYTIDDEGGVLDRHVIQEDIQSRYMCSDLGSHDGRFDPEEVGEFIKEFYSTYELRNNLLLCWEEGADPSICSQYDVVNPDKPYLAVGAIDSKDEIVEHQDLWKLAHHYFPSFYFFPGEDQELILSSFVWEILQGQG